MCNLCIGSNLFLPTQEGSRSEKKKRIPHPFQAVKAKKKGGYCRNRKQKGAPTEQLSASEFLEEIESYIASLSREDCCVSVEGEARKCRCVHFLADKPSVVKSVALGLQKYFDLDEAKRKLFLANE